MELRLGKHNKIRLTQSEYKQIQTSGNIEELFSIGGFIKFKVGILLKNERKVSTIEMDKTDGIIIWLCDLDFQKLILKENEKNGIFVDGVAIQVDLWNESRRLK